MGFVKNIVRAVGKVIAPVPKAPPAQVIKKAAEPVAKLAAAKASAYGGSTILSGSGGVEDEANVSKTILGGTGKVVKKKGKDFLGSA
jgi:hypothetical protein